MPDNVENRVVEMQFDNKDFEQGVSTSLNTLDKLKEALQFENAAKGFTEIQNSIKKIDFSPIESSLQSLESGFMTLAGRLKMNFFDEISNSILNMGQQLYQNTIGQIKTGGQRRAMNIEQAKFKIAGLGENWDIVSKDMDYAVSGTAYGIDQAANAAAQFLASGVQAGDNMKAALRGISGIAAMTSADYDEIANIFTAAAGKGKVQAMELNRISQRGVNAASAIAQQLGTTEEAVRDMASKGELDFQTFANAMDSAFGEHAKKANETFTGSMSNMKAALSRIGEIFYTPYLESMIPVFNRLRETIDKFKNAMKEPLNEDKESVATKIADLYKKLSDLFLAWSDTWEPALDKLPEKMQLWFVAFDHIGAAVDKFKDILVDVGNGVKELTKDASSDLSQLTEQEEKAARDIWILGNWGNGDERRKNLEAAGMSYERVQAVVEKIVAGTYKWDEWLFKAAGISKDSAEAYEIHSWAVKKIIEVYDIFHRVIDTTEVAMQKVWKVLRSIWQAYTETWSKLTNLEKIHSPWRELVQTIRVAIKNFVIAGKRAENLKNTFSGVFAVLKLGGHIIASAIRYLRPIVRLLMTGEPVLTKLTGEVGQLTYSTVEAIIESGKIPATFKKISEAIQAVIVKIQAFAGTDNFSIKNIFTNIIGIIKNAIATIKGLITGELTFEDAFGGIWEKIKTFVGNFKAAAEEIGIPLDTIFEKIKTFVTKVADVIGKTLFGQDFTFAGWLEKAFSANKEDEMEERVIGDKGVIPTVTNKLGTIREETDGLWDSIKGLVKSIVDGITSVWNFISTQINNLSDVFTSIFTFVSKIFNIGSTQAEGVSENIQAFADFVSTVFIVARDIVWSIKEPLTEIAKAVASMIAGIANMFAGITNWVGDDPEQAYGAAALFALIKLVDKIMDYKILKTKGTTDSVLYSIATFFDDMRAAAEAWKNDRLDKIAESIGKSLLLIAGAMVLLMGMLSGSFIGVETETAMGLALQSFLYISAFMWEIVGILALAKNIFAKPIDLTFLMSAFKGISMAMLFITLGLSAVMASAKNLTTAQTVWIMTFIFLIIAEVMAGMAALVYFVNNWNVDEKKMAAVTTFMLALAKGIKSIMKGITWLMMTMLAIAAAQGGGKDAWGNAMKGVLVSMLAVAGLMLALGGALALMFINGDKMPDSKKLLTLAALLIIYTGCIKAIINSLLLLVGATAVAGGGDVWSSLAIVGIIAAVIAGLVIGVIAMLNHVTDPNAIMKGLLGVAAVVLVLGECIKSLAMAAAIISLTGVTASQMEGLVLIVGIISLLMIALAGLGILGGKAAGTSLLAFAGGILMIAASIYVINLAILTIVKAIVLLIATFVALAEVWPTISDKVPDMLDDLKVQLPKFVELVGDCIIQLANTVIEAAPLIGKAVAIVIATIISASWDYIPHVVGSFLSMLDTVLDLLIDGAETILPKMILLLLMFIEYLDLNAYALGYLLADVLMKVIWGALMAIGDFLTDTVFPWLIRQIHDLFANGKEQLVEAISDAALDGPVEKDDRVVLRQTTEINQVTGTHFRYYNPLTDEYYDTLEDAQNAEINEALEKNKEKAKKSLEMNGGTITQDLTVTTDLKEDVKNNGSFKDKEHYKELVGTEELKAEAGGAWDDLKNFVKGKTDSFKAENKTAGQEGGKAAVQGYGEGMRSAVSQDSYMQFLQSQGDKNGKTYGDSFTSGAQTAMDTAKVQLPNVDMADLNIPDSEALKKKLGNFDMSTYTQDLDLGTSTIKTDVEGDGLAFNELAEGKATVSMDSDQYTQALQQNNSTNQEQLTMLEKVKATLDELKSNLKDVIILPKGSNINITNQMDAQVVGKTIEPVVSTIQGRNNVKAKQGLASGGGRYSRD